MAAKIQESIECQTGIKQRIKSCDEQNIVVDNQSIDAPKRVTKKPFKGSEKCNRLLGSQQNQSVTSQEFPIHKMTTRSMSRIEGILPENDDHFSIKTVGSQKPSLKTSQSKKANESEKKIKNCKNSELYQINETEGEELDYFNEDDYDYDFEEEDDYDYDLEDEDDFEHSPKSKKVSHSKSPKRGISNLNQRVAENSGSQTCLVWDGIVVFGSVAIFTLFAALFVYKFRYFFANFDF